jgi:hypothetical protein
LSDYPCKTEEYFNESERIFEMALDLKVLGYIYTSEKNEAQPEVIVRENAVVCRLPRERSSLSEINEVSKNSKFRG